MTDQEACIVLNLMSGIGPARLNALLSFCGTPSEIFAQNEKSLASVPGISPVMAGKIVHWEQFVDLKKELDLARRGGVQILTRFDKEYPELLSTIHDAPICLYVRGILPENISRSSLAIVGTRNISAYGQRMARHLAEAAAYAGYVVVSGLAYGVDAVAHQAVLDAGGETVSVLGGGLARIQPQEHIPLARAIAQHGAVISEFPMEFSPTRHSFPMRNRIISGLSRGTLVIEAGLNSGSLITAAYAMEQGRTVFAVPGQADNPQAKGCNRLIRQNAVLTESFEDILNEFDFLPGFGSQSFSGVREERVELALSGSETDHADAVSGSAPAGSGEIGEEEESFLSSESGRILEFLKTHPDSTLDEISAGTLLSAGEISSSLIGLELLRKVRKNGLRYQRIR